VSGVSFSVPSRRFSPALLLLPVLLGSSSTAPPLAVARTASKPISQTSSRIAQAPIPSLAGGGDETSRLYAKAAAALRRRDCQTAERTLLPLTTRPDGAKLARLTYGLYAHACEQLSFAEEQLFAAPDPGGPLEDWRLFILSDSSAANGHVLLAQAALAKLLGDYPDSPLRPRAFVRLATLAWGQGNTRRAVETIARARTEPVHGDEGQKLEALAWEITTRTGDGAGQLEAARRLLADWPGEATRLHVADGFRRPDGGIDWAELLSTDQLKRRSDALLALDLQPNALAALDAVKLADRDLDWYLRKADALTRGHRGADALTLLVAVDRFASEPRQQAQLEWARGMAAADLASARRGNPLSTPDRRSFGQIAQQHLAKVAALGADRDLAIRALRALYAGQAEAELFDRSLDTLRQLRKLDPADTTGASHLWQLGWREYAGRNYSGAVGDWTELADLYPGDSAARRGRYWTARAFEALGEGERAQQIYDEMATADTSDFYCRAARIHLKHQGASRATAAAPGSAASAAAKIVETWPDDPALRRARLLTDLGLDDLAGSEIELSRAQAEPRSVSALEALILARRGERRKSMLTIRTAFPALGSPYQASLPEQARRLYYPFDYQETIRKWAEANHLPAYVVAGMIRQESGFDTNAVSSAGARGLMQLMPATAKELAHRFGVPFSHDRMSEPAFNLQLGTSYFRQVMSMFDDNLELALAGYNGGPFRIKRLWHESGAGEVDRFLEGLDIEESKIYVKRILVLSDSYRQLYPTAG
jgi:soluble lytic murein transglycosylase-like protein